MAIGGVKTSKGRVYLRVLRKPETQKQYNRFREEVREKFGISEISGFGGHTQILGDGYGIDVTQTGKYLHVVIHAGTSLKTKITETAYKHFGVYAPKNNLLPA